MIVLVFVLLTVSVFAAPRRFFLVELSDGCYNQFAAVPSSGKEVVAVEVLMAFIISVAAGVVTYYICKWLDGKK